MIKIFIKLQTTKDFNIAEKVKLFYTKKQGTAQLVIKYAKVSCQNIPFTLSRKIRSKLTVHGQSESGLQRLSFFHVYFIIGVIFSLSYQS